ncbi:MAG: hypothetical protein HQL14_05885 [Candidatus Omnitrophica bacterium]|nr:hypothetical protein [Candidatus Omnitrophota bacterium]
MKKILLLGGCFFFLFCPAYAQLGNLMNNIKSNPLLAQQGLNQGIIGKIQNIGSIFAQLPFDSGKLEFVKAALPILNQVYSMSASSLGNLQAGKPVDANQSTKINGLLDQVKSMIAQHWSHNPLAPAQIPQANNQIQQFIGLLKDIVQNETDSLQKQISVPSSH